MLKIDRTERDGAVCLVLSGRLDPEGLAEVERAIAADAGASQAMAIDLDEVRLVDRDAVRFLIRCEDGGIALLRCPAYVREWITREQHGAGTEGRDRRPS